MGKIGGPRLAFPWRASRPGAEGARPVGRAYATRPAATGRPRPALRGYVARTSSDQLKGRHDVPQRGLVAAKGLRRGGVEGGGRVVVRQRRRAAGRARVRAFARAFAWLRQYDKPGDSWGGPAGSSRWRPQRCRAQGGKLRPPLQKGRPQRCGAHPGGGAHEEGEHLAVLHGDGGEVAVLLGAGGARTGLARHAGAAQSQLSGWAEPGAGGGVPGTAKARLCERQGTAAAGGSQPRCRVVLGRPAGFAAGECGKAGGIAHRGVYVILIERDSVALALAALDVGRVGQGVLRGRGGSAGQVTGHTGRRV